MRFMLTGAPHWRALLTVEGARMRWAVYAMALLLALIVGLIVYAETGPSSEGGCKPLIGPIGVCGSR